MGFSYKYIIFVVFLVRLVSVNSQCANNVACFAPPIDVTKLPSHNLTVNSTCGSPAEAFCVENDCTLNCDTANNQTHHPASYLIDQFDLLTYWKSKNFDEPVFMQFDFGYTLVLHQISITFQFEFPNGLYIQRSQDFGNTFFTLAYFANRCIDIFGLTASSNFDKMKVLCYLITPEIVEKQISYAPRRDNYIAEEVLKGGIVRDYYLATNVKIVLHEFFKPSDFDRILADPRKFYFAIRDIDVQASCYCNGMSNQCSPSDYGVCVCQKNTDGKNCEKCLPLFNNKPWQFGRACESCACYGHSLSCTYNAIKGAGICNNCIHNTKGDNCDFCNTGYYEDPLKEIADVNYCKACDCYIDGVLFGSTICHSKTGACICKSNVGGLRCDMCKDGFYGLQAVILNGCSVCACSAYGTINQSTICHKNTGQCLCKPGFTGRTCSNCKVGFYGYPVSGPTECKPCSCNPSGSLNSTCDPSGQCVCRAFYYGVQCEQIVTGYFSASVNQLWFSASSASVSSPAASSWRILNMTDSKGNQFYIVGYTLGLGGNLDSPATTLVFTINIAAATYYEIFLQYMTSYSFLNVNMNIQLISPFFSYSCDGGNTMITVNTARTLSANLKPQAQSQSFGTLCLNKGQYKVTIWFPPNSAGSSSSIATIFIMSLLFLPNYQLSSAYQQANSALQLSIQNYYNLASSVIQWNSADVAGAQYLSYIYSILYSNALSCNCNTIGSINPSVCNTNGGQCNCNQNVFGRTCHSCLPLHYNFTSGLGCVACNCDLNGAYNGSCDASGQCNCKPNVVGKSCNQCALRYYGLSSGNGCQPCGCQVLYSLSSHCSDTGQCMCKPGVGSKKCSTCLPGYYDLSITGCKQCTCDPIGTSANQCNDQTGSCTCKNLVMGARCEKCTIGYYGFSFDFPSTCLSCHCTGKTQECDAASDYYLTNVHTVFSTTVNSNGLSGWTSVDGNGAEAGKLSWDWAPMYSLKRGFAKLQDVGDNVELFFSAPSIFLGDKRSSYMYYITFDLTQQNNSSPIGSSSIGDVIMKAHGLQYTLVARLISPPNIHQEFTSYKVRFYEKEWFKDSITGPQATNTEMIDTLSNLAFLRIRGKWTKNMGEFSGLSNVIMDYSTYNVTNIAGLTKAYNVEYCNCPLPYGGQFCQNCNTGYTRNPPGGSSSDTCVPCQCNFHSSSCEPQTGVCYSCQHNTEGRNCDTCSPGYYGIATIGEIDDCKECKCPGGKFAINQFAQTCILDADDKPTCVNCQTGFSGRHCEVCSDGYYGNPTMSLGKCKKCICNNNIDPVAAGNCNTTTGECLRCLYNTVGDACQFCRRGFYGDALTQSCLACSCNLVGSHSNFCQNITGQCSCKNNVIGRICDRCAENTFNFASNTGCELCKCHAKGSASMQCNLITGKCTCKSRVIGDKCDSCAPGYYDLSKGCLPCSCSEMFSVRNTTCDANTGQCVCRESTLGGRYSGRTCDKCDVNAIGTPPNCELCHSPCYDNWQSYIDQEATDINNLQMNVSHLLSRFGGMSYGSITSHLSWLNGNLTYVMDVFSGANYNTSSKEADFQQIETRIIDFETVLNRTAQQLSTTKQYFETVIAHFNGSVSLSATIPNPVPIPQINIRVRRQIITTSDLIDASSVTEMAHGFITTTRSNNVTGRVVYSTIQKEFNEIVKANASIADAAKKIAEALSDLAQSSVERARISTYLDTQYKATFATNAYELRKIHDIVANILILQNQTLTVHQNALRMLSNAQSVIEKAQDEAEARRSEAQTVSQTVSKMKVDAVMLNNSVAEQVKVASTLKAKADEVLYDVQQEAKRLTQYISDASTARNKTERVLGMASEIANTTLPVQLSEIKVLSNQIMNTFINEGLINATYNDAQAGLAKVKEVQARSQQAMTVSQQTLVDIQNLEEDITRSAALRQAAVNTQSETDAKYLQIQNISAQISNQFNSVSGQGGQTLNMLTNAMTQAEANKMCFINAKATVDNASMIANQARIKAQQAAVLHQSNAGLLPTYATQINGLYAQTSTTHANAQAAARAASQLLQDVTEAERLLNDFTLRKTELDALQAETDTLEVELNNLLLKFESERNRFGGCSRL